MAGALEYDPTRVAARLSALDPDRLRFFGAGCAERAAPILTCRVVFERDPEAASLLAGAMPLLWTTPPPRLAEARDLLADLRRAYPPEAPLDPDRFDPLEALLSRGIALAVAVVTAAFECYLTPTPERAAAVGAASYRLRAELARLAKLPPDGDLPPRFATDELDRQRADIGVLTTTSAPRRAAQRVAGPAQDAGAATATLLVEVLSALAAITGHE